MNYNMLSMDYNALWCSENKKKFLEYTERYRLAKSLVNENLKYVCKCKETMRIFIKRGEWRLAHEVRDKLCIYRVKLRRAENMCRRYKAHIKEYGRLVNLELCEKQL